MSGRASNAGDASKRKDAVTQFRDAEGSSAGPSFDETPEAGGAVPAGASSGTRRDDPIRDDDLPRDGGPVGADPGNGVGADPGNGVGATVGAGSGADGGSGDSGDSGGSGGSDGTPSSGSTAGEHKPVSTMLGLLRETVTVVVIALGLSLLIKTFLVQAFYIPSESMENTLLIGDRVLVSKLTPGPFDLERGDVVVFSDPGDWLTLPPEPDEGPLREGFRDVLTFVGLLPADSGDHLIKRVVGLPGDKVACCDDEGRLTVNGKTVEEPYLFPGNAPSDDDFTVTVPAGRLWVMGDHREVSQDSRYHRELADGTVAVDDVVGRAFVVVWPFDRAKLLRTPDVFDQVPAR
jgi:signal peptidase I